MQNENKKFNTCVNKDACVQHVIVVLFTFPQQLLSPTISNMRGNHKWNKVLRLYKYNGYIQTLL